MKKALLGFFACIAAGYASSILEAVTFKHLLDSLDLSMPFSDQLKQLDALDEDERRVFYSSFLLDSDNKKQMEKMFPSYPKDINDNLCCLYYNPAIRYNDKLVVLGGYTDNVNDQFILKAYEAQSDNFDVLNELTIKKEYITDMSGGNIGGELTAIALSSNGCVCVAIRYENAGGSCDFMTEISIYRLATGELVHKNNVDQRITALTFVDNTVYFIQRGGETNFLCSFSNSNKIRMHSRFETAHFVVSLNERFNAFFARTTKELWSSKIGKEEWYGVQISENAHRLATCQGYSNQSDENHMLEVLHPTVNGYRGREVDYNRVNWRIRDNNYYLTYNPSYVVIAFKLNRFWEAERDCINDLSLMPCEDFNKTILLIHKDYRKIFEYIPNKNESLATFIKMMNLFDEE